MRTPILTYLNGAENAQIPKGALVNLNTWLQANYSNQPPAFVRGVLQQIQTDKVAQISGGHDLLGATFAGVVQGFSQVTIHGRILPAGTKEVGG